jgi:ribosomal protein S6--L-glutamate ligase
MPRARHLVRTTSSFRRLYEQLLQGDAVLGPLALRPGEEVKLLDLADRGVEFFPPALALILSRSKVAQAQVLGVFMVPGTFVAYALPDLTGQLGQALSGPVVSKRDRAHLGLGVSLWPTLEALYSLAALQDLPYPLVVQPFLAEARDLRVVLLEDYAEAYERVNPLSFRKNLYQGGASRPVTLTAEQQQFCRQVMARGRFPYAILDLLLGPAGEIYLSEINFHGGLTGARISQAEFRERVARLQDDFQRRWEGS